jgi:hypothetical protein
MRVVRGMADRFEVGYEASCGYGRCHDVLRAPAAPVGRETIPWRQRD